MSFTDQKPRIATEHDCCEARWGGEAPGKRFRCYLCGRKFQPGDGWRWLSGSPVHLSNLIVCSACDGPNEDVLARWKAADEEFDRRFWWAVHEPPSYQFQERED